MNIDYDPALVESVAHTLDMRAPNAAALDAIARALDAHESPDVIADLATGVGKTYIAGGLLDYLYSSGVRNVVIITPGTTIQSKTVNNLTPGHRKYLRGLQCNPFVVTLDTLERGEVAAALANDDVLKVFVLTVQSLLRPNTSANRRAYRAHETVGVDLYGYLQAADDLVVIADEHHVYYSGTARKFEAAITQMAPAATIGLTATPHEETRTRIVYHYPLSDAIADGYVKIPVLVTRTDGIADPRTQMADGLTLLDAKVAAMRAYCAQTRAPWVEPVLFVVAQTIDEANVYRDMLAAPDMLDGDEKVLLVTSEEPDETLALLDTLENPDSPIRAVISVSMLKEGWDVKNIYVIAAVRSMESQLLTEQILGRGLRLPFGHRTGNPMLDTVEVLSHASFATLLAQAEALLAETLGERAEAAVAIPSPVPGVHVPGVPVTNIPTDTDEVEFRLPGHAGADDQQRTLFDETNDDPTATDHVGVAVSTMDARVRTGEAATAALAVEQQPRTPGGVHIPLYLPQVITRWERDPFSLTQVDLMTVEALGRTFADDNAPTLRRKKVDAERDETGTTHVVITDAETAVAASQTLLPFDTIETDLVGRLMATNAVASTVTEANAALAVAQAFLTGAGVTTETPWRAEHGRLATTRLVEWINTQRTSTPVREVREVTHVRWPEPPAYLEARVPADRHLITSRSQFTRGYPYSGWAKSIYALNAFDAYSTEFRLATLFDADPAVAAWFRIEHTVPLKITYLSGAIQRQYVPDFVVVDDDGTYWIVEGKSDSDMTDETVLIKRDAARAWIQTVNDSPDVTTRWRYLLASESVIAAASSWAALKAGAQTF